MKSFSLAEECIFGYSQLLLPPLASSLESHTDSIMVWSVTSLNVVDPLTLPDPLRCLVPIDIVDTGVKSENLEL